MDVIEAEDVSVVAALGSPGSENPSVSMSLCFDVVERTDRLVPARLRVSPVLLLPRLRDRWDSPCVRGPAYGSSRKGGGLSRPSSVLCFPLCVSRTSDDDDAIRRSVRTDPLESPRTSPVLRRVGHIPNRTMRQGHARS